MEDPADIIPLEVDSATADSSAVVSSKSSSSYVKALHTFTTFVEDEDDRGEINSSNTNVANVAPEKNDEPEEETLEHGADSAVLNSAVAPTDKLVKREETRVPAHFVNTAQNAVDNEAQKTEFAMEREVSLNESPLDGAPLFAKSPSQSSDEEGEITPITSSAQRVKTNIFEAVANPNEKASEMASETVLDEPKVADDYSIERNNDNAILPQTGDKKQSPSDDDNFVVSFAEDASRNAATSNRVVLRSAIFEPVQENITYAEGVNKSASDSFTAERASDTAQNDVEAWNVEMSADEIRDRLLQMGAADIAAAIAERNDISTGSVTHTADPSSPRGVQNAQAAARVLGLKKKVFVQLQQFEKERNEKLGRSQQLFETVHHQLLSVIASGNDTFILLGRFIKERMKLNTDIVQRLRRSHQKLSAPSNTPTFASGAAPHKPAPSPGGNTPCSAASADSGDTASNAGAEQGEKTASTNAGLVRPAWIRILTETGEKEAALSAQLSSKLENDSLLKLVTPAALHYDKRSHEMVQAVKTAFSSLRAHERAVHKAFSDFQKCIGHIEKFAMKDKKSSGTLSRDGWMYERNYLRAALVSQRKHEQLAKLLKECVFDLSELERSRIATSREAISMYMALMREHLGAISGALGGAHRRIDPERHALAKAAFEKDAAERRTLQVEHAKLSVALGSLPHGASLSDVDERSSHNNAISEDLAEASAAAGALEAYCDELTVIANTIESVVTPSPQFVVKKGAVQRHTGIWGDWTDGLLVLTWDRCLHMFRSYNDLQPLWSIYMPHIQGMKVAEETNGDKQVIAITDKKNLFLVSGSKHFYIRPITRDDTESWVRCLKLAESSDDLTYCAGGLASAQRADQRAFQMYASWISKNETVPDHVLSVDDESSESRDVA